MYLSTLWGPLAPSSTQLALHLCFVSIFFWLKANLHLQVLSILLSFKNFLFILELLSKVLCVFISAIKV